MEILLKRSTHNSAEAVRGESTGQHRDVSKGTLQWFVENITDLVFEVLRRYERVDKVPPPLTQHSVNFTTSSTQIFVVIESFPQGEERLMAGFRTSIEQNTNFGVENSPESVK